MTVSCLMPTRNRRQFLPRAFACFQAQTHPDCELIVLDNGESVADLIPDADNIRYIVDDSDSTLGVRINRCAERAAGDILAIWDDDDWYHPERIERQLRTLSGYALTGYHSILFDDGAQAYEYIAPRGILGNSLMFTRVRWKKRSFRAMAVGYDTDFVTNTTSIAATDGCDLCVASIHPGNTSPRVINSPGWRPVPDSELPEGYTRI
jgi:glycosyltransferase involved in cell wall biosynthesis